MPTASRKKPSEGPASRASKHAGDKPAAPTNKRSDTSVVFNSIIGVLNTNGCVSCAIGGVVILEGVTDDLIPCGIDKNTVLRAVLHMAIHQTAAIQCDASPPAAIHGGVF